MNRVRSQATHASGYLSFDHSAITLNLSMLTLWFSPWVKKLKSFPLDVIMGWAEELRLGCPETWKDDFSVASLRKANSQKLWPLTVYLCDMIRPSCLLKFDWYLLKIISVLASLFKIVFVFPCNLFSFNFWILSDNIRCGFLFGHTPIKPGLSRTYPFRWTVLRIEW